METAEMTDAAVSTAVAAVLGTQRDPTYFTFPSLIDDLLRDYKKKKGPLSWAEFASTTVEWQRDLEESQPSKEQIAELIKKATDYDAFWKALLHARGVLPSAAPAPEPDPEPDLPTGKVKRLPGKSSTSKEKYEWLRRVLGDDVVEKGRVKDLFGVVDPLRKDEVTHIEKVYVDDYIIDLGDVGASGVLKDLLKHTISSEDQSVEEYKKRWEEWDPWPYTGRENQFPYTRQKPAAPLLHATPEDVVKWLGELVAASDHADNKQILRLMELLRERLERQLGRAARKEMSAIIVNQEQAIKEIDELRQLIDLKDLEGGWWPTFMSATEGIRRFFGQTPHEPTPTAPAPSPLKPQPSATVPAPPPAPAPAPTPTVPLKPPSPSPAPAPFQPPFQPPATAPAPFRPPFQPPAPATAPATPQLQPQPPAPAPGPEEEPERLYPARPGPALGPLDGPSEQDLEKISIHEAINYTNNGVRALSKLWPMTYKPDTPHVEVVDVTKATAEQLVRRSKNYAKEVRTKYRRFAEDARQESPQKHEVALAMRKVAEGYAKAYDSVKLLVRAMPKKTPLMQRHGAIYALADAAVEGVDAIEEMKGWLPPDAAPEKLFINEHPPMADGTGGPRAHFISWAGTTARKITKEYGALSDRIVISGGVREKLKVANALAERNMEPKELGAAVHNVAIAFANQLLAADKMVRRTNESPRRPQVPVPYFPKVSEEIDDDALDLVSASDDVEAATADTLDLDTSSSSSSSSSDSEEEAKPAVAPTRSMRAPRPVLMPTLMPPSVPAPAPATVTSAVIEDDLFAWDAEIPE